MVESGVIFVDLSLAQVAALGTTIAALYGIEPHGQAAYFFSLAFTFVGAGIFSTIRGDHARIPQEAVIGISFGSRNSGDEQIDPGDGTFERYAGGQHPQRFVL